MYQHHSEQPIAKGLSLQKKTNEKGPDKDEVCLKRKRRVIRSMQGHQISQKEGSPFGILELFEANIARECFFKQFPALPLLPNQLSLYQGKGVKIHIPIISHQ